MTLTITDLFAGAGGSSTGAINVPASLFGRPRTIGNWR